MSLYMLATLLFLPNLPAIASWACVGLPSTHRLSSYTQMSSVAEPSIGSLIGSLEAEEQLEGKKEKEMHASSLW